MKNKSKSSLGSSHGNFNCGGAPPFPRLAARPRGVRGVPLGVDLSRLLPRCSKFGAARRPGLNQRGGREVGREAQGGASSADPSLARLSRLHVSSSGQADVTAAHLDRQRRGSSPAETGTTRPGSAAHTPAPPERPRASPPHLLRPGPALHLAGRGARAAAARAMETGSDSGQRPRARGGGGGKEAGEAGGAAHRGSAPRRGKAWRRQVGRTSSARARERARAGARGAGGGGEGWLSSF